MFYVKKLRVTILMNNDTFIANLLEFTRSFDSFVENFCDDYFFQESRLHDAMRYALLSPGKRIRPALCVWITEGFVGKEVGYRLGLAHELIHAYSLVHDDLPSMDDDNLRRGQPTVHRKFEESTAILCGDALQSLAFEVLSKLSVSEAQRINCIQLLAQSAGFQGMALGQSLDIFSSADKSEFSDIERIHQLKTAKLIQSAVGCGAILREDKSSRWTSFGFALGMLFQLVDDLIDVTSSTAKLGKTAGKDLNLSRGTAVNVLGLSALKEKISLHAESAKKDLSELGVPQDSLLFPLITFLASRES